MEKLTTFFNDIKDRISNPLFSSFLISWLLINWQVPVALIFYSNESLKVDGYVSYISLINTRHSTWRYYIFPLLASLLYTFGFPFIRNWILAFQTWVRTWGNNWNLEISKSGKVSMNRYIMLREKYHEQTKLLEDLYNDESTFKAENDNLRTENIKLTTEKNALNANLYRWTSNNDTSILDGEWELSSSSQIENIQHTNRIRIKNGTVTVFPEISNVKSESFVLIDFFYNAVTNRLCLFLASANDNKTTLV